MTDSTEVVDLGEIVYVLQLARDGWPEDRGDWDTGAFAFAAACGARLFGRVCVATLHAHDPGQDEKALQVHVGEGNRLLE